MATVGSKILFDWFFFFFWHDQTVCTQRKLLMSGSKSGKKKNSNSNSVCQLPFSLITPLPQWKKQCKNVNLEPRKVCTVKTSTSKGRKKKITSADIKKGAEVWTFIKKKSFSPQRVLMRRAVDVAFTARNIVPLKELRGACVCDWLYSPIRLCSCDALTRLYASLTANSPPLLAGF